MTICPLVRPPPTLPPVVAPMAKKKKKEKKQTNKYEWIKKKIRPTQQSECNSFLFFFFSQILIHNRAKLFYRPIYGARKYSEIMKNQSSHNSKQSFGSSLRSLHQAGLRKEGCRGKVCQLLLAEGLDLQVLGKKCAADLEYIVCVVLGAFPRVLTGSWDDSIHRHWMSLDLWGSWRSCFGDLRLSWVP